MIKLASFLILSAVLAPAATFTGVITESMCVKNHKPMNMGSDADCVRSCVKSDKSVKYVLFDGKATYKLSDQQTPGQFAAQRVRITGTLFAKTGVISMDKIELAR